MIQNCVVDQIIIVASLVENAVSHQFSCHEYDSNEYHVFKNWCDGLSVKQQKNNKNESKSFLMFPIMCLFSH